MKVQDNKLNDYNAMQNKQKEKQHNGCFELFLFRMDKVPCTCPRGSLSHNTPMCLTMSYGFKQREMLNSNVFVLSDPPLSVTHFRKSIESP